MAVQARGLVLLGLLLVVALAHAAPGVVSVSGTTTFLISQSTTITVTLTPPPTVPTSIQITTTSRTIAYSSHQTLDFNPGQSTLTFSLISPPNGRIGTATIVLTPADLLAYAETSFAVTVQGTIALSLVSTCSGVGLQTVIQATISPPAVGNVYLTALSNLAGASSAFFNNGQKTSQTTFLEPFRGPATVMFSNPFYATQSISYNVIGAFQTTLPALVTMTQTTFSITSTPSLAITRALITGNIPVLPSFIVFDQGAQLSFTTTTTFPAGTSSFTITAPGYCPLTASVFSEPDIVCPIGFAPSAADRVCLKCPGFGTTLGVCSNRGTCTQSTCLGAADNRVTCKCVAGFSGEACQYINQGSVAFQTAILGTTPSPLKVSGSDFTLSVPLPTSGFAGSASGENILVAPYGPLPFYGSSIATGVPFRGVATPIGFAVSVLCSGDNALLSTFPAVQITASFGADLTEREFTLTRLFYWDAPSQSWLPETRCTGSLSWTPFLETLTATVSVCNSGEYHVFIVDQDEVPPVPITEPKARPVELTTGQTGLQPQFPADPSFAVYEFLGEPLRLPIGSHDSASTVQPIVAFTVLCALFLALLS